MSILNLSDSVSGGGGVPAGAIVIWSGTAGNIPAGWHLCDGEDGTPDLRDKFVLGAGETHGVGDEGGAEKVALIMKEMPLHQHYITANTSSSGSYDENRLNLTPISGHTSSKNNLGTSPAGGTSQTGVGAPHENMPPYYTLCYIMKL